jgi:hypothetical protein
VVLAPLIAHVAHSLLSRAAHLAEPSPVLVALVVVVVARTAGVSGACKLPFVSGFDPND